MNLIIRNCGLIFAATFLCLNVLLCMVCAQNEGNDNDVNFDFNQYYKVVINSTKPTSKPEVINGRLVTLYNPNVWPGPDDTNSLTTLPSVPMAESQVVAQPTRFRFGLRRTLIGDSKNMGYGYDYNQTLPITTPQPTSNDFGLKTYNQTKTYSTAIANNAYNNSFDNSRFYRRFSNISGGNYRPQSYTPYRKTLIDDNRNPVQSTTPFRRTLVVDNNRNTAQSSTPYRRTSVLNNNPNPVQSSSFTVRSVNTAFSCVGMHYYGYYADMLSNCQRFHVCTPDGRQTTFLCPINTLFNQVLTICDWYYNVNCQISPNFYQNNAIKFREWNAFKLG